MSLIVKDILIQLLILLHLVILHPLKLRLATDCTNSLADELLDADWNVLIYEVLHSLYLIKLFVK